MLRSLFFIIVFHLKVFDVYDKSLYSPDGHILLKVPSGVVRFRIREGGHEH